MDNPILKSSFRFSEAIAKRYYDYYAPLFQFAAIQEEDLLQEARLATIEKYNEWIIQPHSFNLKAHLSVKVGWSTLNRLKQNITGKTIGHLLLDKDDVSQIRMANLLSRFYKKEKELSFSAQKKIKYRTCFPRGIKIETVTEDLVNKIDKAQEKLYHSLSKNENLEEELEKARLRADLEICINNLPSRYKNLPLKKVYELTLVKGMSLREAAKELNKTYERVRQYRSIIIKEVKKYFSK